MGLCEHGNEPYSSVVSVEYTYVTVSADISFISFQDFLWRVALIFSLVTPEIAW